MLELNGSKCFSWLKDFAVNNSMTLDEINDAFTQRHIGGMTFVSILMLSGLVGNSTVLWIYGAKFKRSNYRTYTLWLATMDLMNCCIGMPFLLIYLTNYVKFPSIVVCKIGRFTLMYTANASALLLVVIGVDRYRRICHPLKKQISEFQAKISCISVSVLALFISSPNLFLFGYHKINTFPFSVTGTRCWEDDNFRHNNSLRDFYISICVLSLAVTGFVIMSYSSIVKFLYNSESVRTNFYAKKTTITMLIVTAAYVISALPHNILIPILLQLPSIHCYTSFVEGFTLYIFVWSNLINNSVNPFIYGFSDMRFKKEFKTMISDFKKKSYKKCGSEDLEN